MRLILASASPRRRDILAKMGIDFEVVPSSVSEDIDGICSHELLAMQIAAKKAAAVFDSFTYNNIDEARQASESSQPITVLGADTIVVAGGRVLGKPTSKKEAIAMLLGLKNSSHEVITGICFYSKDSVIHSYDKTVVSFKDFDLADIEGYVDANKSYDKAGGYGIQDEEISALTKGVSGSLDNVIGLPSELIKKILGVGI